LRCVVKFCVQSEENVGTSLMNQTEKAGKTVRCVGLYRF